MFIAISFQTWTHSEDYSRSEINFFDKQSFLTFAPLSSHLPMYLFCLWKIIPR
uniref:Uncharacterized protein n=1 Tax=Tetranychus urticae TaxID=32264 RepID=T1JYD6_TETUR